MIDEGIVERLKHSREIVGELSAILVDEGTGEIISGTHRERAGFQRRTPLNVQSIAEKLGLSKATIRKLLVGHTNIQRQTGEEESRSILLTLAKDFEDKGVPKEMIAREVVKLSFLSESRTLLLLPDEYKQKEKAVSPGRPPSTSVIAQKQKSEARGEVLGAMDRLEQMDIEGHVPSLAHTNWKKMFEQEKVEKDTLESRVTELERKVTLEQQVAEGYYQALQQSDGEKMRKEVAEKTQLQANLIKRMEELQRENEQLREELKATPQLQAGETFQSTFTCKCKRVIAFQLQTPFPVDYRMIRFEVLKTV